MPQEIHPALTPERQQFRQQLNLRLVTIQERGMPADRLPDGVFGYTTSPATDEVPLFDIPIVRCFEIHKVVGGELRWIGYVTEKEAEAFKAGVEPVSIDLYPDPYDQASVLISVPETRVDRRKPPTRDHGNSMRLDLAPSPDAFGLPGAKG